VVQTPVTESAVPAAAKASRAGRDVPVAIGVGVAMAVGFSVPLFVFRPIVVLIISAAAAYGLLELVRALRVRRWSRSSSGGRSPSRSATRPAPRPWWPRCW